MFVCSDCRTLSSMELEMRSVKNLRRSEATAHSVAPHARKSCTAADTVNERLTSTFGYVHELDDRLRCGKSQKVSR